MLCSESLIHIKSSKGQKGRYKIFSQTGLKECYGQDRPEKWLFERVKRGQSITIRNVQTIFKQVYKREEVNKKTTIHTFLDSVWTHSVDSRVNSRYIKKLLVIKTIKQPNFTLMRVKVGLPKQTVHFINKQRRKSDSIQTKTCI